MLTRKKSSHRKELLKALRAMSRLKRAGRDDAHQDLCFKLLHGVPTPDFAVGKLGREPAAFLLRQSLYYHLLQKGGLTRLMRGVAGENGPIAIALPHRYRAELQRTGFPLAPLGSALAWGQAVANNFVGGVRAFGRHLLSCLSHHPQPSVPHVELVESGAHCAPPPDCSWETDGYFTSWYWRSPFCDPHVQEIRLHGHLTAAAPVDAGTGTRITNTPYPFPPLRGTGARLRFLLVGLGDIARAALEACCGRPQRAFVLRQLIDLAYFRQVPAQDLPRRYFFRTNFAVVRPLWTYQAEAMGIPVTMLQYSYHTFFYIPGHPEARPHNLHFAFCNWPEHAVWDETQAELLRTDGDCSGRHIVVPEGIYVFDGGGEIPSPPGLKVAVFDVSTGRPSNEARRATWLPYLSAATIETFLADTLKTINEVGAMPVWKSKGGHSRQWMLDRIASQWPHLALNDQAPLRLARQVDAAVCLPFSAPAKIAALQGCPSCYYDPTGLLRDFQAYARGLPIFTNPSDLNAWLTDVLSRKAGSHGAV